jgi:two-component system, OmpR family, sensor histidine kinase CreC
MRDELESKDYVEETVHALTHELKSPLAAIRGAVEILRDEPPADVRSRFLDNIQTEGERLQRVVDRMLLLATVEQRDVLSERTPVDLVALVRQVLDSRRSRAEEAGVSLAEALPDALTLPGDAFLLEQAAANLVDNAIDFSPPGAEVTTAIASAGDAIELTVTDAGPGIPDYALARIFERFYSLPRPQSGQKSTGLGLSFVREAARLHHGRVTVDNREGGGARAVLHLPRG